MTTTLKEGARVQIADRPATADDVKSGLFYNHFRGLTGIVEKVYASNEVAVHIEHDALPEAVAARHLDVQEQMKAKWLDGLSEEGRNRLSEAERDFRLRYTVLVGVNDVSAAQGRPKTVEAKTEEAKTREAKADHDRMAESARRATSDDLSAAEAAEIARRKSAS